MTFENVDVSLHGTVALLRFANPFDSANTLGMAALRELRQAAASACEHRSVRLLIVTGKGRSFCAGAAIGEWDACKDQQVLGFLREGQSLLQQVMDLDVITIAAVNGIALGARAVFGLPEAKLGLLPGWGALSLLRRTVPASLGVEMVASGEFISAGRAYEAGLVSRLFQERNFQAAALAEGRKLADKPAGTLRELKALLRYQRGKVDLSAADSSFLKLWNGHDRSAENPCENGRRRK